EMGINMIRNGSWIIEHAAECKVPLLLMQGSADHLVSPAATQSFAEKATGCSLTYKIWDGFYHETHNEPQKAQVLQTMTDWLDLQVSAA
ncbi:MAG: alpha/beta hydrolase, partial [Anaerolineaceae bacterium]